MSLNATKFVSLGCAAIVATSCVYHGGERARHELRRPDGTPVTCFEPPPEVVKKANIAADIDASAKEIGTLAKASVRGEVTPERIRGKLPTNVAVFEVIDFRLYGEYANGLLTSAEYRAFVDAKSGLSVEGQSKRMTERAWVTVKDARIIGPIEMNSTPRVNVTYHNSGPTPALRAKVIHNITILKSNKLPDGPMPTVIARDEESVAVFGPGALLSSRTSLVRPLSKDDVIHLNSKEWIIVTFGAVTYVDTFDQEHETRFCLVWRDTTHEALTSCDRWNEAN
jgi:hypothetical protein